MEPGFRSWYKEKIKEASKGLLKLFAKPFKKTLRLVERVIEKILDPVDPFIEAMIALVGGITVLIVLLLAMFSVLPPVYCLYSLITAPIYITLFAHSYYRDLWPYLQRERFPPLP